MKHEISNSEEGIEVNIDKDKVPNNLSKELALQNRIREFFNEDKLTSITIDELNTSQDFRQDIMDSNTVLADYQSGNDQLQNPITNGVLPSEFKTSQKSKDDLLFDGTGKLIGTEKELEQKLNESSEQGQDKSDTYVFPNAQNATENNSTNDFTTAIDDKVREIEKQKLPDEVIATFQDGNYRSVEAINDMTLYRVYGEKAGKQGCFLTTEVPTDRLHTKLESALLLDWCNSRQYYCEVEVPKGTVLNIGKVAKQYSAEGHSLRGGADQVVVSPQFAEESWHFKTEHELGFAGNYLDFEKKARKIESDE